MINWDTVIQAVLLAIIGAVVPSLIKWLQAQAAYRLAQAKAYQPELTEWLADCAEFAVKAAEQSSLSGLILDKKQYALQVGEKWLATKGIIIDLHLLEAAIEKAVLDEFPHEVKML